MLHLLIILGILHIFPSCTFSTLLALSEGNSFVQYVDLENGNLQTCSLYIPSENISLYPNKIQSAQDKIKERLISFEKRACGFKLKNFRKSDPYEFQLTAKIIKDGKVITKQKNITIDVKPHLTVNNITQVALYGEKIRLQCSIPGRNNGFCSLYSPKGDLQEQGTDCQHELAYVTKEDFGTWKCEVSFNGDLEPKASYIRLQLKNLTNTQTWYKEQNGYGIIGCKFADTGTTLASRMNNKCSMITPSTHVLNIAPHSASSRYDSFGTNYTENLCQIEFKLPIQQHEIGTWTCMLNERKAFIHVKQESLFIKETTIVAKLGDSKSVSCEVPFSAKNCFVIAPSGKVSFKDIASSCSEGIIQLHLTLKEEDFGQYECHFGKTGTHEDILVKINIERYDEVDAKLKQVDVAEGEDTVILFGAKGPISFCILEDPKGHRYHISPTTKTSFMEYYGSGFELGECGIILKHINKTQEGVWKCMTDLDAKKQSMELMAKTQINVQTAEEAAIAKASTSAILFGFVFAVAAVVMFLLYGKYQKKQKVKISPANSIGDEDSTTAFALTRL